VWYGRWVPPFRGNALHTSSGWKTEALICIMLHVFASRKTVTFIYIARRTSGLTMENLNYCCRPYEKKLYSSKLEFKPLLRVVSTSIGRTHNGGEFVHLFHLRNLRIEYRCILLLWVYTRSYLANLILLLWVHTRCYLEILILVLWVYTRSYLANLILLLWVYSSKTAGLPQGQRPH
jgi:hypothetical protein